MPGFLLLFFFFAILRQNLSDAFPTLVSWNVVWLPSLGMTRFLFVCFLCVYVFWLLLFTPISATFLNRSACDEFNADGFIFNHSKQKNICQL